MTLVWSLFYLGIIGYFSFLIYLLYGIGRIRSPKKTKVFPTVSIIIAARNEEKTLSNLLQSLIEQDYPKEKLEIVVADDRSTDQTWNIIENFQNENNNLFGVRITEPSKSMTGKKNALTKAINRSTGKVIVTTDADCIVQSSWVSSMLSALGESAGICVGFSSVTRQDKSFLFAFQHIDFLGLMTTNAGAIGMNKAWSGSGQNLAYRRSYFQRINGFNPVAQRISGDDVYLVQSISKFAPIVFNSDPDGFVSTQPLQTWFSFFQQRIRWASNSRHLYQGHFLFLGFLSSAFLMNTYFSASLVFHKNIDFVFWGFLFMKFLFDYSILSRGAAIFHQKLSLSIFLVWFFFQPIYIPIIGLLGIIGKFRWK